MYFVVNIMVSLSLRARGGATVHLFIKKALHLGLREGGDYSPLSPSPVTASAGHSLRCIYRSQVQENLYG